MVLYGDAHIYLLRLGLARDLFEDRRLASHQASCNKCSAYQYFFLAWDAYAIAQGHWFFDREQMLGIYGPFSIPLEEYIFFMVIPMAAIFTIEGVTTVKPHWRKDEFGE